MSCNNGSGTQQPQSNNTTGKEFIFKNATNSNFSSLEITNESENKIFTTNYNCKMNETCIVKIPNDKYIEHMHFKFFNGNSLVSALMYDSSDMIGRSFTANNTYLGIYVFHELKKHAAQYIPIDLYVKLINLFKNNNLDSATISPTVYDELGLYYLSITSGQYNLDQKFFNQILLETKNGTVLPHLSTFASSREKSSLTSNAILSSDPTEDSPSCKLGKLISPIFGAVGKAVNVTGAEGFFGVMGTLAKQECMTDQAKLMYKLNYIINQLNELQSGLREQGLSLDRISEKIDENSLKQALSSFNSDKAALSNTMNTYRSVTLTLGESATFSQFVKLNGGIEHIFNSGNTNAQDVFQSMASLSTEMNNLMELNRLDAVKTSLNNLCNDSTTMTTDIMEKRRYCNLTAAQVSTMLISLNDVTQIMLHDIWGAASDTPEHENYAKNSGKIKLPILNNSVNWSNIPQKIDEWSNSNVNILSKFIDGLYVDPYKGLPQDLYKKLLTESCSFSGSNDKGETVNLPAIEAWYDNSYAEQSKKIITVHCPNGLKESDIVSNYNFRLEGNDPYNILGVLVGYRPVDDSRDVDQLNLLYNDSKFNDDYFRFHISFNNPSDNSRVNINGTDLSGHHLDHSYYKWSPDESVMVNNDAYSFSSGSGFILHKNIDGLSSNYRPNAMSQQFNVAPPISYYDPQTGRTQVFTLALKVTEGENKDNVSQYAYLRCITTDCQRTGWGPEKSILTFDSGLKVRLDRCGGDIKSNLCIRFWH